MAADFKTDMALSFMHQTEIIKEQVLLEVIQVATQCETYEEFRKALYGMALEYLKKYEKQGVIKPGTTESVVNRK